jgi:DNA polymerase III epsilon subunit-like protein
LSALLDLPSLREVTMKKLLHETAHRCHGGKLPDSYLVCDSETSGVDPKTCRILQYGFAVVIDRKVEDHFTVMMNHGNIDIHPKALEVHGIDAVRMAAEGVEVAEGMKLIFDTLKKWCARGLMFVGHNMIRFDAPFIEYEIYRSGHEFRFGENDIVDTGIHVKASQLGMYYEPTDTLRSFAARVNKHRAAGVYWALDRYCWDVYRLGERTGLRKEAAHDAGVDCFLTHHLLEALREDFECRS